MGGKRILSYKHIWYCSNCGEGPFNYQLVILCPDCEHHRCEYCQVNKLAFGDCGAGILPVVHEALDDEQAYHPGPSRPSPPPRTVMESSKSHGRKSTAETNPHSTPQKQTARASALQAAIYLNPNPTTAMSALDLGPGPPTPPPIPAPTGPLPAPTEPLTACPSGVCDPAGQPQPPEVGSLVMATSREVERILCFQVKARGITVSRRDDNDMVNGTKLLEVAGMGGDRGDAILRQEKVRHVVENGPLDYLKGVWIRLERAVLLANEQGITDLLYPLFEHDIRTIKKPQEDVAAAAVDVFNHSTVKKTQHAAPAVRIAALATEDCPQPLEPWGSAAEPGVPITDSGYASAFNTLLPSTILQQPKRVEDDADAEDDAITTYSAATTVSLGGTRRYVSELSKEIIDRVGQGVDPKSLAEVCRALPELVKAFCIKIGHESPAQLNREVMFYIHKHHRVIVSHLESVVTLGACESPTGHHDPAKMSLLEKMSLWYSKAVPGEAQIPAPDDNLFEGVEDDEDASVAPAELSAHNTLILESAAFKWLVSSLRTRLLLRWDSDGMPGLVINTIRQKILEALPTGRISKRQPPREHTVTFRLKCGHLLNRQSPEQIACGALEKTTLESIIVTASCPGHAQAASVEQYLNQTWPCSWRDVFELLQEVTRADTETRMRDVRSALLADKTLITARLSGDNLLITATGPAYTLAECGELLAWLTAAFWPPVLGTVMHHTPLIVPGDLDDDPQTSGSPSTCFDILVAQSPVSAAERRWTNILKYKSGIVHGFPITRRPLSDSGLEASFDILAMAGYHDMKVEDGKITLRGPEKALILIKRTDEEFLWGDAGCLNGRCCAIYTTNRYHHGENGVVRVVDLDSGRHIVVPCGNNSTGDSGTDRPIPAAATTNTASNRNCDCLGMPTSHDGKCRSKTAGCLGLSGAKIDENPAISVDPGLDGVPSPRGAPRALACLSPSEDSPAASTDASFDSDLLSMSDSLDLISSQERTNSVIPVLWDALIGRLVSAYQGCINGAASGDGSTASTSSTGTPHSATEPTGSGGKKRKYVQCSDGASREDDFPSQRPPRKRVRHLSRDGNSKRILACPFWKADPGRYRCCFAKVLSRIRDVKQHLYRKHMPDFYCERCSEIFPDEQSHQRHVSNDTGLFCKPSSTLDGISHQQRLQIARKSNSKFSEEEQWFAIWDIVFPGRDRPGSAYRDADISEDLCSFREYCRTHGEDLLEDEVRSVTDSGQRPGPQILLPPEETRSILRWAMSRGLDLLFGKWRSTASDPAQRREQEPGLVIQGQGNNDMPSQYAIPAASSALLDSGVAVGSQPPASSDSQSDNVAGSRGVENLAESAGQEKPARGGDQPSLEPVQESLRDVAQGGYYAPLTSLALPGMWDPMETGEDQMEGACEFDHLYDQYCMR